MGKTKQYITTEEYEEALVKFYNGYDNFTDHINFREAIIVPEVQVEDIAREYLDIGEEYTVVQERYMLTSYGRVFNYKFRRFLKPKFYNSDIYIYCGENNYKLEPIFKKMGWKFDKVEILRRYLMNDWGMKLMDNCKYVHLAE